MLYTKKKTFNYFYNKKNGQPISGQDKTPLRQESVKQVSENGN
jgi:hypothetical protein